jgi:DNA-binding Lrp family transcriptional regulator
MAKSSVKQIEKDEKKILNELSKNANKSINDIAGSCGFSRQKVWRVINNLEKNNTIWGYVAVVNQEKLNKKDYLLLIKRTNKPFPQELIDKIIDRDLVKKGKKIGIEMINSFYTHGIYDWIIHFIANDIREVKTFLEIFNELYEGYISEVHLIENMFAVARDGVTNPDIKKLKDFFKV